MLSKSKFMLNQLQAAKRSSHMSSLNTRFTTAFRPAAQSMLITANSYPSGANFSTSNNRNNFSGDSSSVSKALWTIYSNDLTK